MTQLSDQPQAANNSALIEELLTTRGATWAVVGLTDSPHRVAKPVASFLKNELGMRVVPVNPRREPVNGDRAYRRITEVPHTIDVLHVFVNADAAEDIVDDAIRLGIENIWFQLDVDSPAAIEKALAAGVTVVADTCPSVDGFRRIIAWRM